MYLPHSLHKRLNQQQQQQTKNPTLVLVNKCADGYAVTQITSSDKSQYSEYCINTLYKLIQITEINNNEIKLLSQFNSSVDIHQPLHRTHTHTDTHFGRGGHVHN